MSRLLLFAGFLFFSLVSLFLHYKFSTLFSFVDEYTHYVAADYMLNGKVLYQDIFFQHQPLPVYMSFVLQQILHPDTLYKLIIEHRLAVFAFSFLFNLLLVYRFRFVGLGFVVVYELTKYYLFGNLFLGETFIALPLVYLLGLVWEKWQHKKIHRWDYLVAGFFTWFILFTREPYVPTTLLLFFLLLIGKENKKDKISSLVLTTILSVLTVITLPVASYITDLIVTNFSGYIQHEVATNNIAGIGLLKIFFYPFIIFFVGEWNEFRWILIVLAVFFFVFITLYLSRKGDKWKVFLLFIILGSCAIRVSDPGVIFYEGFHMLPWYALFVMIIFLLWNEIKIKSKWFYLGILFGVSGIIFLSPHSYMRQEIKRDELFTNNYSRFYTIGTVIKTLGEPNQTVFADRWDSLVYWQAGLPSSYEYVFSYPVMDHVPQFKQARSDMFKQSPPDFYWYDCPKKVHAVSFTQKDIMKEYTQLHQNGKPVCLYVKESVLSKISADKWKQVSTLGFYR